MADHPTKSIACEEENLLVLEREKFIVFDDSPPYTFFLLNDDMELHRNRHLFIQYLRQNGGEAGRLNTV